MGDVCPRRGDGRLHHGVAPDRISRLEAGPRLRELGALALDAAELGEMGLLRIAGRPLALADDLVDGSGCGREVTHDVNRRGLHLLGSHLQVLRADEDGRFAAHVAERRDLLSDPAIELANRLVVGGGGHERAEMRLPLERRVRDERVAVGRVGAFGSLELQEVLERVGVETRQLHNDGRRRGIRPRLGDSAD